MTDTSLSGSAATPEDEFRYRGNRLGLPSTGPGSIPGVGRRLIGLALDWALAVMLAWAAYGTGLLGAGPSSMEEIVPLVNSTAMAVFAVVSIVLLTLFGTTVGRRIVGVGITATGERSWPWILSMTVRTLLLCLVVPAVIYDRDTRGLHDRAAGTVATRY